MSFLWAYSGPICKVLALLPYGQAMLILVSLLVFASYATKVHSFFLELLKIYLDFVAPERHIKKLLKLMADTHQSTEVHLCPVSLLCDETECFDRCDLLEDEKALPCFKDCMCRLHEGWFDAMSQCIGNSKHLDCSDLVGSDLPWAHNFLVTYSFFEEMSLKEFSAWGRLFYSLHRFTEIIVMHFESKTYLFQVVALTVYTSKVYYQCNCGRVLLLLVSCVFLFQTFQKYSELHVCIICISYYSYQIYVSKKKSETGSSGANNNGREGSTASNKGNNASDVVAAGSYDRPISGSQESLVVQNCEKKGPSRGSLVNTIGGESEVTSATAKSRPATLVNTAGGRSKVTSATAKKTNKRKTEVEKTDTDNPSKLMKTTTRTRQKRNASTSDQNPTKKMKTE